MDNSCQHSGGGGDWKSDEISLIQFRGIPAYSETRRSRHDIKPSQTKCSTSQEKERHTPPESLKAADCPISPGISENGGGDPKRQNVGDAVEFDPEFTGRFR